jgi:hypothetical protein
LKVSTLDHKRMFREGRSHRGAVVTERRSADFIIDGTSLLQALDKASGYQATDLMGCFVEGFPESNMKKRAEFTLEALPDTQSGRVLLYICPECGDIGCGAYAVRIERSESGYVWRDFSYENGYEEPSSIENLGPFLFELQAYEAAIKDAASL